MKKSLIFIVFIVILGVLSYAIFSYTTLPPRKGFVLAQLSITTLALEVADTKRLQTKGLSKREKLLEGEGMLFVFQENQYHGFWMKDMRFSIDILWFDENYRLVDVQEAVPPESYPKVFHPHIPARYVVELPAHFISKYNIELGDVLQIPKK